MSQVGLLAKKVLDDPRPAKNKSDGKTKLRGNILGGNRSRSVHMAGKPHVQTLLNLYIHLSKSKLNQKQILNKDLFRQVFRQTRMSGPNVLGRLIQIRLPSSLWVRHRLSPATWFLGGRLRVASMSDNQLIRHLLGVPISLPLLSAPSFVLLVPYSSIHATPNAGVGLGSISVVFGQSRGLTQIIWDAPNSLQFWILDFRFWIEIQERPVH